MSSPVNIKINHLTSLHEARFAAGMGVSYIGFCAVPNTPHFIAPAPQKTILTWLDGVQSVLEIGDISFENKRNLLEEYAFNFVETSDWRSAIYVLEKTDLGLIFRTHLNADWSFLGEELKKYASKELILHIADGEMLDEDSMTKITRLSKTFKIMLGYGFDKDNVKRIAERSGIFALSLNGTREEVVGMANFENNADLLELICE